MNVPEILSITITSEEYINESNNITQEKFITSCLQKFYYLYKMNSNPGMISYLTSIPNPRLD